MELGDLVKLALTKVGVTEERVERFLGRPCGCAERREKLNMLDRWARMTIHKNLRGARAYFDRLVRAYEDCQEQEEYSHTKEYSNPKEQQNDQGERQLQPTKDLSPQR